MSDTGKFQGTVKWFSNRKGYGFITPGDGCPVTEDIFVHQSTIHSDGYRTLSEGWTVEFSVGKDDDGKVKAENVTAPGGGYVHGPRPHRHRRDGKKKPEASASEDKREDKREGVGESEGEATDNEAETEQGEETNDKESKKKGGRVRKGRRSGPRPPPQHHWHEVLSEDVKKALGAKEVRITTGTIDVSSGSSRIKLGTRGYASLADAEAILAEGTFECSEDGKATFEWKRALKFDKETGEWNKVDEKMAKLPLSILLNDDSVGSVGTNETAATLWGNAPTDPRSALEENGFEMRRVVLTTKRR